MRNALIVAASLCLSSAAVAADDPGLMLNDMHAHARQAGVAAQATFTVPLGTRSGTTRTADAPTFDLRAGPSLTSYGGYANSASRTRVAPTIRLSSGADAPTLVVGYPGLAHRPDEPPVEHATVDPETDPREAAIVDARRRIFDWFDAHMR